MENTTEVLYLAIITLQPVTLENPVDAASHTAHLCPCPVSVARIYQANFLWISMLLIYA